MMMKCSDVEASLFRRRDGDLKAGESHQLDAHLLLCADCRLAARALDFHTAWQRSLEPEVPIGFAQRVMRRIQESPALPFWAFFENLAARFLPATVAVVTILAIGLVGVIQRDLRRDAEWHSYEVLAAVPQRQEVVSRLEQGTFDLDPDSESSSQAPGRNGEK